MTICPSVWYVKIFLVIILEKKIDLTVLDFSDFLYFKLFYKHT